MTYEFEVRQGDSGRLYLVVENSVSMGEELVFDAITCKKLAELQWMSDDEDDNLNRYPEAKPFRRYVPFAEWSEATRQGVIRGMSHVRGDWTATERDSQGTVTATLWLDRDLNVVHREPHGS